MDFDDLVNKLQEQIFEETVEAFGEEGFERWRNPRFKGEIKNPEGYARITGSCGDTMQIFLNFDGSKVKEASYITDGCGSSIVCGSFTAEMAIGKTFDEIFEIEGETILKRLGTFPKEDEHCAFLAAETLHEALGSYLKKVKQSETD